MLHALFSQVLSDENEVELYLVLKTVRFQKKFIIPKETSVEKIGPNLYRVLGSNETVEFENMDFLKFKCKEMWSTQDVATLFITNKLKNQWSFDEIVDKKYLSPDLFGGAYVIQDPKGPFHALLRALEASKEKYVYLNVFCKSTVEIHGFQSVLIYFDSWLQPSLLENCLDIVNRFLHSATIIYDPTEPSRFAEMLRNHHAKEIIAKFSKDKNLRTKVGDKFTDFILQQVMPMLSSEKTKMEAGLVILFNTQNFNTANSVLGDASRSLFNLHTYEYSQIVDVLLEKSPKLNLGGYFDEETSLLLSNIFKLNEKYDSAITVLLNARFKSARVFHDLCYLQEKHGDWRQSVKCYKRYVSCDVTNKKEQAALLHRVALSLDKQGEHQHALPMFQQLVKLEESNRGRSHPNVASALNNVSNVFMSLGQYEDAMKTYENVRDIYKETVDDKHHHYATSLGNLASVYETQGMYDESLEIYQDVLAIYKETLGEDHQAYGTALNNIAFIHSAQGNHIKAIKIYSQVKTIFAVARGTKDMNYIFVVHSIAIAYYKQGQFERALKSFLECKSCLPAEHRNHYVYPSILEHIGNIAKKRLQFQKAIDIFEQSLKVRIERMHQENTSPQITALRYTIATACMEIHNYSQAAPHFEKCLQARPNWTQARDALAQVWLKLNRMEQASTLFDLILDTLVPSDEGFNSAVLNTAGCHYGASNLNRALELYTILDKQSLTENEQHFVMNRIALIHEESNNYDEAMLQYQNLATLLTPENLHYATVQFNIGNLLTKQGLLDQALSYLDNSLRHETRMERYVTVVLSKAGVLEFKGMYQMAIQVYQDCLSKQSLGETSPGPILNKLGILYQKLSNYEDSLKYFKQALDLYQHEKGANYVGVLTSIALLYKVMGMYKDASELLKRCRKICGRNVGVNNLEYAAVESNLAGIKICQGKFYRAIELLERVRKVQSLYLDQDHPIYELTLANISSLHLAGKLDLELALKYSNQSLQILRSAFGDKHPEYATAQHNNAIFLTELKRYDQALDSFQIAENVFNKVFGENHCEFATLFFNEAKAYRSLGDFDNALQLYTRCLEICQECLSPHHIECAHWWFEMGNTEALRHHNEKALLLFQESLDIFEVSLGAESTFYTKALMKIAVVKGILGDVSSAITMCSTSSATQLSLLGPQHPQYVDTFHQMAYLSSEQGNYDHAIAYQKKGVRFLEKALGKEHEYTLDCQDDLIELEEKMFGV